ncbi:MAG TPA: hypothetical protein DIC52_19285 [Candidatus Latescibacteria bacterium]|jgi:dienelactone hydrolase|nr:hypothetical protein [Candidatus Latescibacterota bacterium]|tara:strand:- start:3324 stop:4103 length:780 start_codon:yes stop_codon:yes gene_type:complete
MGTNEQVEGSEREDFVVAVGERNVTVTLLSPPSDRLAAEPALLMSFASGRESSLLQAPYNCTSNAFLAAGHRALSFDFTGHGERIDHFGSGIHGLRNSLVKGGIDPFAVFAEDARAVIDNCVHRGLAAAGRIVTCGTSRGGYLALYLLVHEPRIVAAAGYAPVTDWRLLAEFEADVDLPDVVGLALSGWASKAADRSVFLAIGKSDARVGTESCEQLRDALDAAGVDVEFLLTDDPGHSLGAQGYKRGAALLLDRVGAV